MPSHAPAAAAILLSRHQGRSVLGASPVLSPEHTQTRRCCMAQHKQRRIALPRDMRAATHPLSITGCGSSARPASSGPRSGDQAYPPGQRPRPAVAPISAVLSKMLFSTKRRGTHSCTHRERPRSLVTQTCCWAPSLWPRQTLEHGHSHNTSPPQAKRPPSVVLADFRPCGLSPRFTFSL